MVRCFLGVLRIGVSGRVSGVFSLYLAFMSEIDVT